MHDTSLEGLHPAERSRAVDVVFIHGLKGDPHGTWTHNSDVACFWPRWVADDHPDVGVWVYGYPSTVFDSSGRTLPTAQIANNLAHRLRNAGVGDRPVIFVAHSLGGLVLKHMLNDAAIRANRELKRLWRSTAAIAFLGTPHAGTDLASIKGFFERWLRFAAGVPGQPKANADELAHQADALLAANSAFRQHVQTRHDLCAWPRVVAYRETQPIGAGVMVVESHSADPGLAGAEVVDLPFDHFEICKLASREGAPYGWLERQIDLWMRSPVLQQPLPDGDIVVSYPRRVGEAAGQDLRVYALVRWLRSQGLRVVSDLDVLRPKQPWPAWRDDHFGRAYTVIVVGSPEAQAAFDAPGDAYTGATLSRAAYLNHAQRPDKFVPVLFDGDDPMTHLPDTLRSWYNGFRYPAEPGRLLAAICTPPQGHRTMDYE